MSVLPEDIDRNNHTLYIDGMRAGDLIHAALREQGKTQKSLAEELGFSAQNFNNKLINDRLSAKEFFRILDALNMAVIVQDKDTGEEIRERKPGVLPRISMVVGGVRYDTHKADALCHASVLDGWTVELYRDYSDRYFVVICPSWNANSTITPCEESDAMRFLETHGTVYEDVNNDTKTSEQ